MTDEPSGQDAAAESAAGEGAPAGDAGASNEERVASGDRSADTSGASEAKRRAKVERLREEGIDPYPHSFLPRDHAADILAAHDPAALGEGEYPEFRYRLMGRVTGKRGHGKLVFLDVRDVSGTIQAVARRDKLGEEAFDRIEALDLADIVGIEGVLYVTKRGELAVAVETCTLLAPALKDPPDLFHGIKDPEVRYRQRELDLIANEESRDIFKKRSELTYAIREYMHGHGWTELETPILQRLTGGAAARPFVTHHNALDRDLFLRTATELYLKRAIVGGFEDVYEFGKMFRNEGMSPNHNPEFTMLEMFVGGADWIGVMEFQENLVSTVVEKVMGTTVVERDGVEIDFKTPWPRVVLRDEILKETGVDIYAASRDELAEVAGADAGPDDDWAGPRRHAAGQAGRAEADPADLHHRAADRHLAAGQEAPGRSEGVRGVRRDRRRPRDPRRRDRHQRSGRTARTVRRPARPSGDRGGGGSAPDRPRVRAGAGIRHAARRAASASASTAC